MIEVLNSKMQKQFDNMCQTGMLFKSTVSGDKIWDLYLNNFEDDPVFRDPESSTHNCNLCNNFIRRYGNVVAIDSDYNIMTIWDVEIIKNDGTNTEFKNSFEKISKKLKSSKIENVFFETYNELNSLPYEKTNKTQQKYKLGIDVNHKRYTKEEAEKFGVVKANDIVKFNHFHLYLPTEFVDKSGSSVESIMGIHRDSKNVFQRGIEEISLDTLELVKDLINQDSLLDGKTHLHKIEKFIPFKKEYDSLSNDKKDNWFWVKSYKLPIAKFKNELIGVLCSDLSEGLELNKACQDWNKRVDPANYMKAVAPITKKQIEEAKKFVQENGYEESFIRRFATIDDIKVSEILHSNVGDGELKNVSIFDDVKATSTRHKKSEFDNIEEVNIEKFMKDILPSCCSVEVFLLNKHESNLVTLTTSKNEDSKKIFKWDNNYSWTFNGNLAGKSMIKDAVKSRGGNVDGIMNIRLAFPNTTDDYDLHVHEPNGDHIYYSNVRRKHRSSGILDLDAQGVDGHQSPEKRVENIIYDDINSMPSGTYKVSVNNYSGRGFHTNFNVEIEINGDVTSLELEKLNNSQRENWVDVAEITLKNGNFDIKLPNGIKMISSNSISKEVYGIKTNEFHKVNLVCLSPNHWGDNNIGNKHYMFMLENAKTDSLIRGFHNENLKPELTKHRKVLEVLGNTSMIEPNSKQLSGLGFNATVRDELVVKVKGSFKRMLKIKF